MINIIPAIIPEDRNQLEEEISRVAGFASTVQVDICDGIFVPNKTWPYNGRDGQYWKDLQTEEAGWPEWEEVDIEIHLMVAEPEKVLQNFLRTGVSSVVVQIEAVEETEMRSIIEECKGQNISIGLALKPSTNIESLTPYIGEIDFIQCMGSDTLGEHGVALDPSTAERVGELRRRWPDCIISVDIGVTKESAPALVAAGATKLVVGSAILNSANPEEFFDYLSKL